MNADKRPENLNKQPFQVNAHVFHGTQTKQKRLSMHDPHILSVFYSKSISGICGLMHLQLSVSALSIILLTFWSENRRTK